ncbi:terminase large subunit [Pseudoramibacter alactolyticus]|uniref:terminase large subunit n=1 Tax=Pseudoramibacter alactolyticus TaxID=113287 RepID=UPI002356FE36|nr:terminase large subunit [Pseudoramibacter alactolyticus]MBM6968671.1 terminase large subunit [Pseudoramibacter alactolyticus]
MATKPQNDIEKYHTAIQSGKIVAGRWIKLLYNLIIDGLNKKTFFFDEKRSKRAIRYIETFCHHHEGPLAPNTITLELWQRALLCLIYGIVDEAGNRWFREVFIIMARKQGKTLLAAAIASYNLYADREYGARIYFAAPKLEQASLCYDALYQSILQEPELASMTKKRRTDLYVAASNSSAKPIAFNAKKSDGLNISLGIADEIASWRGDGGLKFYEVLRSSFGARTQPLLIGITTAGFENDGIYDELMRRATRVLKGDSEEKRLLPILYMIDDVDRWDDIEEIKKAAPNMGVSVKPSYFEDEIAIAHGSLSKKAEFLTKYCNIKQNASTAWLTTQTIEQISSDETLRLEDFRNSYCVGGIDLSQTTDLTACCAVIERQGKLYVFCQFFLPAERIDEAIERDGVPYRIYVERGLLTLSGDNFIDYNDCFNWFCSLIKDYQIYPLQVGYDRYSSQYLVQDMKQYGFHMDDVYQGDNLWPVLQEMEGIMKDGNMVIGTNDLLKSHLLNSAIKMSLERGRGKLIKIKSNAHIDGTTALADAMTVRQKWYSDIGEQLKNEG